MTINAATAARTTFAARRLTEIKRGLPAGRFRLPEALALWFEQLLFRDPPGEAEESRVGDHPVRRAQASTAHCPASLQQLVHLEHPEAPRLPKSVEKALHLAHVRAVREHDPAGSQRAAHRRHRLPRFGQVQQEPVHVAFLNTEVDVAKLESEVGG